MPRTRRNGTTRNRLHRMRPLRTGNAVGDTADHSARIASKRGIFQGEANVPSLSLTRIISSPPSSWNSRHTFAYDAVLIIEKAERRKRDQSSVAGDSEAGVFSGLPPHSARGAYAQSSTYPNCSQRSVIANQSVIATVTKCITSSIEVIFSQGITPRVCNRSLRSKCYLSLRIVP